MSYHKGFYLVRHGDYDKYGDLSVRGREVDAVAARDRLILAGLGGGAVLLSSDAPRAIQTARVIGAGLGVEPKPSRTINTQGNHAWNVRDLDVVVEEALREVGVDVDPDDNLVVVTHAPMVAIAQRVLMSEVDYGAVFHYERGSWSNPDAPKE